MERTYARLRRRWRAARPWLLVGAGVYAFYFGAALLATLVYYDAATAANIARSAAGGLFLASAGAVAAVTARWLVDYYRPDFEPGRPRDEYLSSNQLWFDEER